MLLPEDQESLFQENEFMNKMRRSNDNFLAPMPHFAEGGPVDLGIAPQIVSAEEAAAMAPPPMLDPAMAKKQQYYNEAMLGLSADSPDYQQALQFQNRGQLFTPGQLPQDIVPSVWAGAEKRYQTLQNVNQIRQEQEAANIAQKNQARVAAGLQPLPVPGAPEPSTRMPQAEMQMQPQAVPEGRGQPGGFMGSMQGYMGAYDRMAQEEAKMYGAQAKIAEERHRAMENLNKDFQGRLSAAQSEMNNAIEDYKNQKINPNNFMESMSTGQKVRTAIGLILGGIGGGMTHSENPALKFLNAQIDRDVEAQKMRMAKGQNVLAFFKEKYGNIKDAMDMAKAFNASIYANEMEQEALKAGGPMARARAQMMKAQFLQPYLMMAAKVEAGKTAESALERGGPHANETMGWLQQVDPEKYKDIQARYVPGVGVAQVPVPEKVRADLANKSEFMNLLTRAQEFVKQNGSSLALLDPAVRTQGAIIGQSIQSKIREVQLGTVFKESEQKLLDKMVKEQPLTVLHRWTVDPQLREIKTQIADSLKEQMKFHGFPKARLMEQQIPQYAPMIPKGKK